MSSIIYQVRHKDSSHISYLIGSVHVSDQRLESHMNRLKEYIDLTETTAFEIDFNDVQPSMEDFIIPDHGLVSSYVSVKRWEKMRKFANKKFSIELNEMNHFYPMIILNTLQEMMVMKNDLMQMDVELYKYAMSRNKEIKGLENTASHYDLIHHIDLKLQVKMLKDFLGNISKQNKYFERLLSLYYKQDITTLYKIASKGLHGMRGAMLYSRNRVITANFRRMHQQSSITAVLGVAHLPGQKGVLRLLKKQGFKITPINLNITKC